MYPCHFDRKSFKRRELYSIVPCGIEYIRGLVSQLSDMLNQPDTFTPPWLPRINIVLSGTAFVSYSSDLASLGASIACMSPLPLIHYRMLPLVRVIAVLDMNRLLPAPKRDKVVRSS